MKKFLFIFIITGIFGCKKNSDKSVTPIGCIEQVQTSGGGFDNFIANQASRDRVAELFANNHLNQSDYYFYNFDERYDTLYTGPHLTSTVRCVSFANGLQIFTDDRIFDFTDGQLYYTNNSAGIINLNTTPHLELNYLKALYNGALSNDNYHSITPIDCIAAEFGYYDLNAGTGNTSKNYVKAWKMYPKGSIYLNAFPIMYVKDSDGSTIYFSDGIIN